MLVQRTFQINMIPSFLTNICHRWGKLVFTGNTRNNLQSINTALKPNNNTIKSILSANTQFPILSRLGSTWRYANEMNVHFGGVYPNKLKHHTHQRHYKGIKIHTYGIQKQSRLRPVCNAQIGREALAEGRPPKVIHVYSKKHALKHHGAYGKLGDRVLMTIKGEMKKGIIVGLRANQLHGVPRFDSNNVVFIDDTGSPIGNRINVPIPNCIKPILKRNSHPKKADYTKLFAIATKFV